MNNGFSSPTPPVNTLPSRKLIGLYALLVFPFGDPGVGNYVSNVKREDMIDALREAANRLEKNKYMPPCIGGIN